MTMLFHTSLLVIKVKLCFNSWEVIDYFFQARILLEPRAVHLNNSFQQVYSSVLKQQSKMLI